MEQRKEIDEKLHEIDDREELQNNCSYIKTIKDNIKNTSINRLEELRVEFLKENMDLFIEEMLVVNKVFDYLKQKA